MSVRTLIALVAMLLVLSACGSDSQIDWESHTLKVFTDQERKQIEERDERNPKAVVANGYRAVGTYDRQAEQGGTRAHILFAKCVRGQAWEECAKTRPTAEEPHFFITGWWLDNTVEIGSAKWWRFEVGGKPLDCETMWPMNEYMVTQVTTALQHFIGPQNTPITGVQTLSFPENPNPNSPPGMGKGVGWHCHLLGS